MYAASCALQTIEAWFLCGNSYWATKDINVMCMDCNEILIKVEK